jgi:hypothetical protein
MALSPAAPRSPLHTRRIVCEGFRREDGDFDIEARILDIKAYGYTEPFRGHRAPGDPVHDMTVRLTVSSDMVVRAIEVDMPETPYTTCQGARAAFQGLTGARIGPGWRKAVNEAVGGVRGCTHVRELLFPMATVAFQTIGGWSSDDEARVEGTEARVQATEAPEHVLRRSERPYFLDGCISWASDGEIVAQLHPQYARPLSRD